MVKLIYIFLLLNFLLPSNTLEHFPPDDYNSWIPLKKDKIRVKYSKDFQVPWCRASANFRFSKEEIYDQRKAKFLKIGRDKGFTKTSKSEDVGLGYEGPILSKIKRHVLKSKYIYLGLFLVFAVGIIAIFN